MSKISTSMLSGRTVLSRFLESAKKHPNRIAVKKCDSSISYQAIHELILNIAGALHQLKIGPGNRIAVELTPSIELIAVLLAIQYVGAAYVPLDKKAPQERNLLIINDAKPDLIIIDRETSLYSSFKMASIHSLVSCSLASDMGDRSHLDNTAYIIYTSGTTGRPKGVPITHHNLDALFSATDPIYNFNEQDATLLYHSYAFDFSVWEIWAALAYGGKLVIPDEATRLVPAELARLIKEEKITILNQTPTAFSVNADKLCQFKPDDLSLRYIIFGGERLNYQTLTRWSDKFGFKEPTLVNMYGITETTVHATWHTVNDDDLRRTESNIGYMLPNFDYIIRPLESDITMEDRGELLLSGPQVTNGYLNIDNENNSKFIQKEIDGVSRIYYCSGDIVKKNHNDELIYLGRSDDQVKINGFRIETGEVESVLAQLDEVEEISVLAASSEIHGHHLICFFTTPVNISETETTQKLKSLAKIAFPVYMRPLLYRKIDNIPKTVNGKADKKLIMNSME